jgi:hypothetical protein
VNVPSNGSVNTILNFQATASTGNYNVNAVGVHGSLSHGASLHVNVKSNGGGKSFQAAINPNPVSTVTGVSTITMVSLTSINGYTGPVALSTSISTGSVDHHLVQDHLNLQANSVASTTLQLMPHKDAKPGNYIITLKATAGPIVQTITVPLIITSYTLNSNPTSLTLHRDSTGKVNIVLTSVNGFTGNVQLKAQPNNNQISTVLGGRSIQLSANGSATISLTVRSNVTGDYNVKISVTYGTLVKTFEVKISVVK